MNIIINGDTVDLSNLGMRPIDDNYISYEYIITQAGYHPKQVVSVTYITKFFDEGSVRPGNMVKLVNGMHFSVFDTSNA